MSAATTLPIAFDRSFSLHMYWVNHGLLLLRSGKTNKDSSRIDILFSDVRWMALPVWFEGIRIERGEPSDIPLALTAKIKEEAHFMTVFRVTSQGVTHCLLAGDSVSIVEDQQEYFADSSLLPNFDFRVFGAPLRTKAQPSDSPNGGPAAPIHNSEARKGPHR